ncbi:hypothetical protein [Streptomyces sp. cg35]|uniref:hypothetical protein n=1 Tax=Streptomyces sp. cg35 TaxID=3421650 RepID=UPI003D186387
MIITPAGRPKSPYGVMLAQLVACICQRYATYDMPLCVCEMRHHGTLLIPDNCADACACRDGADGVLYGRTVEIRPYQDGTENSRPCADPMVEVEFAFAVYRCVQLSQDGSAPPSEVAGNEAHDFLVDATLLRAALLCCDLWQDDEFESWRPRLSTWTPMSGGNCAGGEQRLIVAGRERLGRLTFEPVPLEAP